MRIYRKTIRWEPVIPGKRVMKKKGLKHRVFNKWPPNIGKRGLRFQGGRKKMGNAVLLFSEESYLQLWTIKNMDRLRHIATKSNLFYLIKLYAKIKNRSAIKKWQYIVIGFRWFPIIRSPPKGIFRNVLEGRGEWVWVIDLICLFYSKSLYFTLNPYQK